LTGLAKEFVMTDGLDKELTAAGLDSALMGAGLVKVDEVVGLFS
jgi:hypothetical protein